MNGVRDPWNTASINSLGESVSKIASRPTIEALLHALGECKNSTFYGGDVIDKMIFGRSWVEVETNVPFSTEGRWEWLMANG